MNKHLLGIGCVLALGLMCGGVPAVANEALDVALSADRQKALQSLQAANVLAAQYKSAVTAEVAAGEAAQAAGKQELAALQKQILAAIGRDDAAALQTIRARIVARQTFLDAEEGALALRVKQSEEAERACDSWKKRAASLELALRLDMRAMLAGPAEMEDRDKRVDAAEKEIVTQEAQVRKFQSRRDAAVSRREILLRRLEVLTEADGVAVSADVRRARVDEAVQLRRLIAQQEEWFRFNRQLEVGARRNRAFACADALISRRYADALARKAHLRRAEELQSLAERAEVQLTQLRAALAPLQKEGATNLALAAAEVDAVQKSLGSSSTAQEEERFRATDAQAQARKGRWEGVVDCWKELSSLQRAGAAFAHELADRARSLAEEHNIADINQEEEQLRASLITSEQYVHTLELQLQKLDAQIDAARRDLGLTSQQVAELATPLAELLASYDATRPPAAALLADLLRSQAERVPQGDASSRITLERRQEAGALLLARLGQRELLRVRKGISDRWLENSRGAIQTLEQLAGQQLWQPHDLRLNAVACRETWDLVGAVAGSADYAWDCWGHHIGDQPGVPAASRFLLGLVLVLLLGIGGWLSARAMPERSRLQRLARCWVAWLPALAAGAAMASLAGRGNLALLWLGWLLLAVAGWVVVRNLLLACTRSHALPAGPTLGRALLAAVSTLLLWTVVLGPFHRIAEKLPGAWDTQTVLMRLWMFGASLALFRLVMHPALAGRFLSRRSEHAGLRWLGSATAILCITVAALATLTYLAGLNNLGASVLHTAEGTFAMLAAALAGAAILGRVTRQQTAASGLAWSAVRVAQAGILLAGAAAVLWLWWLLLNRAVLANNAPQPVPEIVQTATRVMQVLMRLWQRKLSDGVTVASLTRGVAVVVASFWVSRRTKEVMLRRVLSRTPMDDATRQTFGDVSGWLVIMLGFLVGMNVAGSSLQNLALLAGAITVGVGFGLQNVINNFVSSLLIHFGRSIRVGDYIEVGTIRGTVREIGMRNTVLSTDDEITVLVPNGSFISGNIVNWTNPTRRIRLHVAAVVVRQADLTAVAELVVAEAGQIPMILKTPAPVLEVRAVTATQVTLDVQVWSERPEKSASIVGELSLALDRALRAGGFAA